MSMMLRTMIRRDGFGMFGLKVMRGMNMEWGVGGKVGNGGMIAAAVRSASEARLCMSTSPPRTPSSATVPPSTALPMGYADEYYDQAHLVSPGDTTKRAYTYLVLGTAKFIMASAARATILKFIYSMSASADVLARGSVEVDLASIPLGQSATIKWRGKPVFIRHRTDSEIAEAEKDDNAALRDPETDADRVKRKEWLVLLGVCTHLGCVPIANAGDFGGWFCPCHGSHYDLSGRIRKGPAPLNLEVPKYEFMEDDKMILG
mmetsp:Transcript_14681/g.29901  ORF Transcript_14681/g.29901 Transcript_14681/m.29901 type:complete len:261 (-) Transcript_14681:1623-2405(-)